LVELLTHYFKISITIRLTTEFPATGGAYPTWTFRTVKLIRYVTALDYFVLTCEIIFGLFVLYYTIEEALEVLLFPKSGNQSFYSLIFIFFIFRSKYTN